MTLVPQLLILPHHFEKKKTPSILRALESRNLTSLALYVEDPAIRILQIGKGLEGALQKMHGRTRTKSERNRSGA
jgi:hypothetical protein